MVTVTVIRRLSNRIMVRSFTPSDRFSLVLTTGLICDACKAGTINPTKYYYLLVNEQALRQIEKTGFDPRRMQAGY